MEKHPWEIAIVLLFAVQKILEKISVDDKVTFFKFNSTWALISWVTWKALLQPKEFSYFVFICDIKPWESYKIPIRRCIYYKTVKILINRVLIAKNFSFLVAFYDLTTQNLDTKNAKLGQVYSSKRKFLKPDHLKITKNEHLIENSSSIFRSYISLL